MGRHTRVLAWPNGWLELGLEDVNADFCHEGVNKNLPMNNDFRTTAEDCF
jgi:hypothetical protein